MGRYRIHILTGDADKHNELITKLSAAGFEVTVSVRRKSGVVNLLPVSTGPTNPARKNK